MTRGRAISYTDAELSWIQANSNQERKVAHAQFVEKFNRPEVSYDNFKQLCTRNGWKTGRTGCFPKGHAPANKGKTMPYNAGSARTQFKKGKIPPNAKPVGYESLTKDGYINIIVAERNPHTGCAQRPVPKHKYLWEKLHGKIPRGHCLKCIDGNKQNTDPSNWELIPRSVLVNLNHHARKMDYDTAPTEIKPVLLTMAKLKAAKHSRRKNNGK